MAQSGGSENWWKVRKLCRANNFNTSHSIDKLLSMGYDVASCILQVTAKILILFLANLFGHQND